MKRLYEQASVEFQSTGYAILLDGRPALTPLHKPLMLPTQLLAEAVAKEWLGQGEVIKKESMPLTRIACIAMDLISTRRAAALDDVLAYADTDLVCYRSGNIPVLFERQKNFLNPIVTWASHHFQIELAITDGLMPVTQPAMNQLRLKTILAGYDDLKLAVLISVTKPLGSIILALGLCERHISAAAAFDCSHQEEAYETEQWGPDEEKEAKLAIIRQEIDAAEQFLSLLVSSRN